MVDADRAQYRRRALCSAIEREINRFEQDFPGIWVEAVFIERTMDDHERTDATPILVGIEVTTHNNRL